jgi:hypothetical protein
MQVNGANVRKAQTNGRKWWRDDFSLEVWWLANRLLPIEVSPRIASPLSSSQARNLGLPHKVDSDVSTRLESVNQQGTFHASDQLELLFAFLSQARA